MQSLVLVTMLVGEEIGNSVSRPVAGHADDNNRYFDHFFVLDRHFGRRLVQQILTRDGADVQAADEERKDPHNDFELQILHLYSTEPHGDETIYFGQLTAETMSQISFAPY